MASPTTNTKLAGCTITCVPLISISVGEQAGFALASFVDNAKIINIAISSAIFISSFLERIAPVAHMGLSYARGRCSVVAWASPPDQSDGVAKSLRVVRHGP